MRYVNWRRREVLVEMLRTALGCRGSYKEEIVMDFTSKSGVFPKMSDAPFLNPRIFWIKAEDNQEALIVSDQLTKKNIDHERDCHQERCKETWLIKKISASGLIDFCFHKYTDKWLNQPALYTELMPTLQSRELGCCVKWKKYIYNTVICFCNIPSHLLSLCQLVCNVLVASKFR